ncbi:hypothetical protein [Halpernia sp.]
MAKLVLEILSKFRSSHILVTSQKKAKKPGMLERTSPKFGTLAKLV